MTPIGEILADEIRRSGPISFRRFMEQALYHPEYGYYRRPRDPFGARGDFFTAEQIQPVFGILMAARIRQLHRGMGEPADFTVVELGAGRREMAEAFSQWQYIGVDVDGGELPRDFQGVVFSNEFFDALPVEVFEYTQGELRERRVDFAGGKFSWRTEGRAPADREDFIRRYFPEPAECQIYEVCLDARRWLERIAGALRSGYVLTIDYGFTRPEAIRFPSGTLMSYRSHTALDSVLENPGEQDITAHVNFTAIEQHGESLGLRQESFETLARTILTAGEVDQFAAALQGGEREELRRRMQLKTLLFGMGETFRALLQRKSEA